MSSTFLHFFTSYLDTDRFMCSVDLHAHLVCRPNERSLSLLALTLSTIRVCASCSGRIMQCLRVCSGGFGGDARNTICPHLSSSLRGTKDTTYAPEVQRLRYHSKDRRENSEVIVQVQALSYIYYLLIDLRAHAFFPASIPLSGYAR